MVRYHSEKTTCLGKIWFSSYGPKILSTNQIAGIFDHLYLLKGLIPHFDFLHAGRHPWTEEAESNALGWSCPDLSRHAQLCPILPNGVFVVLTII